MEDVLKRMEHQFGGLSCVELSQIYQLMLRVQALHSLTAMDQSADVGQLCSAFLAILNRVSELSLIHISEPTRLRRISYQLLC